MQAYSLMVDPDQTYDSLKELGNKLKLPAGWKFRVNVLDQDLTIRAVDGIARIVQDDLENTYVLCGGSSNYKPWCPDSSFARGIAHIVRNDLERTWQRLDLSPNSP